MHRISPFPLLRDSWRSLRAGGVRLLVVMLAFHLLLVAVASPLIGWLFREALRANGMVALDMSNMGFTSGIGITFALILVILLIAFWLSAVQLTVLVVMLQAARDGHDPTARAIWNELRGVARKLWRPSSFPLFLYLFLILPLSGFGFVSVLAQGITVPTFISGELLKSPVSAAVWSGFLVLLALLNLRFALTLPVFVHTTATGGRSMRLSWRLTRGWASFRLLFAVVIALLGVALLTLALVVVTIIPTAIADEVLPAGSPIIAAFSLGISQLLSMVLTALAVIFIGGILLSLVVQREDQLPADIHARAALGDPRSETATDASAAEGSPAPATSASTSTSRRWTTGLLAGSAVVAVVLGVLHIDTMRTLSEYPQTLALGHRGFSSGGAENTVEGLEAASAAGVEMVEIDVMQTADKRFVIMHDPNLVRLTGQSINVKDLTLDELTEITVTDQYGHEGKIPSLETYMKRAAELEMPLLIEIKMGGLDSPDHVELLVDELESLDAIDGNIFHTLDPASVKTLKQLRPDTTVGYILAFAGVDVPETVADFIVIEEWSATEQMQQSATRAGLGFFSWTVNDEPGIRELLRRNADGIITDHPDVAMSARTEMQEETGLAGTLLDALTRFVVVI